MGRNRYQRCYLLESSLGRAEQETDDRIYGHSIFKQT